MKIVEIGLAVVWDAGRILVTRRPENVHLGGLWEFPGGKREADETIEGCASRQLQEEVGLVGTPDAVIARITHRYPDRTLELVAVGCSLQSGRENAACREVTELRWIEPLDSAKHTFPAANSELWPHVIAWAQNKMEATPYLQGAAHRRGGVGRRAEIAAG